jgi:CelD/BcsL family acetyltransferase involved in cellulose biosynthesis
MAAPAAPGGRLQELEPAHPAWMRLVSEAPESTAFHHPAWLETLAATYGYERLVLATVDTDGQVLAGLPLVRVRRLKGRAWVSLPFTDHCPPLARDPAALAGLAGEVAAWRRRQGLPVEVRGDLALGGDWRPATVGTRHLLDLDAGAEALWSGLRSTYRRNVRTAGRAGLRVRFSRGRADLDVFYRLHLETRRRQGVPVQPRRFLAALWRHLVEPSLGMAAIAETQAGEPVAAAVLLGWNRTLVQKFQASDAAHWQLRPNQLLIWAAIEWACQQGWHAFDFGRSDADHESLQHFKAGWGAKEVPLRYTVEGSMGSSVGGGGRLGGVLRQVIRRSPAVVCRALGGALYRFAA